jgi:hypothetical protein
MSLSKHKGFTMKKLGFLVLVASAMAFGVDYSTMSLTELQALRGTVAEADRSAFQTEMQSRMSALTPEERQAVSSSMKQSKSGTMSGTGTQSRKGSMQRVQSTTSTGVGTMQRMRGGR